MTDMIDLARRICMGEHIPPLKDGPAVGETFDAMFPKRPKCATPERDEDPFTTQPGDGTP